ncbi:MAG: PatB family C-S lyase [Pseudomonadota bacterium]
MAADSYAPDAQPYWRTPLDRRGTSATKWEKYADDVLPFWVADMDLPTPEPILAAIRERLEHPLLGYTNVPESLTHAFIDWAQREFDWAINPAWLVWVPGVVAGLNVAARAVTRAGDPVYLMPPVYYPFLAVPEQADGTRVDIPLTGARWEMDLERLREVRQQHGTGAPAALLLCNPQNPTGRCYARNELEALAQVCIREDLVLISDEIHCDLRLEPAAVHTPVASLDAEIAQRTITLMAPTKTWNMPGLGCAVAVIPNPRLRSAFRSARIGMVGTPSVLGYAAAEAAYRQGESWVNALRNHLRDHRDRLAKVTGPRMRRAEATYLGWIDVPELPAEQADAHFRRHGLGLSMGADFGGPGYVRFNFGCSTQLLEQGLARLRPALEALPASGANASR